MATNFTDIIKMAITLIDDVRDQRQLANNPALFYRRYSGYVEAALPLLNRPPELYTHLRDNVVYSSYADEAWISTSASTASKTDVSTSAVGYDLCSVVAMSDDGTYEEPYTDFTYDPDTGVVTFGIQEAEGISYDINFYNDGFISQTLTPAQLRLFALAVSVVWNERFTNNWLNLQPKIKDSVFETVNESNYMEKLTARAVQNRQAFQDELKKYEQDIAYANIFTKTHILYNPFGSGYTRQEREDSATADGTIIRGNTPTIQYTFDTVKVAEIASAYMTIKQSGNTVIQKTLADATVGINTIDWTLTQQETLSLSNGVVTVYCDWVLDDGIRGSGATKTYNVTTGGIEDVI